LLQNLDINDSDINNEYSLSGYVVSLTYWSVPIMIMKRLENVGNEEVQYLSVYRGRRGFLSGRN
jgi:hypothetical protein